MKNHKLKDVFPDFITSGAVLTRVIDAPWYNTLDSKMLDIEYLTRWAGEKLDSSLTKAFENDEGIITESKCTQLAALVKNHYIKKWEKLWTTLSLEYNPIHNVDEIEDSTDNMKYGKVIDTTANTDRDVHGFNDAGGVDDSEVQSTGKQTDSGTDGRTYHKERKGNIGVTSSQDLVNQEREVWQYDFIENVFKDLDNLLTLKIFESEEV